MTGKGFGGSCKQLRETQGVEEVEDALGMGEQDGDNAGLFNRGSLPLSSSVNGSVEAEVSPSTTPRCAYTEFEFVKVE